MTPLTGNILVVDDDDDFRQRMSSILTREGLTVRTAASAAEALDHLSNNIDLIILDTVMPVRDGYRFLQDLRGKGRSTPVIMVGDNQPQDKDLVVAAVGLRLANFLFKTTLKHAAAGRILSDTRADRA